MAASAACSHPHVYAHTLRFSARGFLALTNNAWFVEVPFILSSHMEPFLTSFLYSTVFHQVNKPKNSRCQSRNPLTAAGAVALRANRLSPNG